MALAAAMIGASNGVATASRLPPLVPASYPSTVEGKPITGRIRGPETVLVQVTSGFCEGDLYRPHIERIALAWKRTSTFRFRAVLTAFVRDPLEPPHAVAVVTKEGEAPKPLSLCLGLGLDLRAKVELPGPIARTTFFDGSYSPPRRMELDPPYLFAHPNS